MTEEPGQESKDVRQDRVARNVQRGLAISVVTLLIVIPLVLFAVGLQWYLTSSMSITDRKDLAQGLGSIIQALAILIAGVVGLAGLYFTRQTLLHNQRALRTTQENTKRTLRRYAVLFGGIDSGVRS